MKQLLRARDSMKAQFPTHEFWKVVQLHDMRSSMVTHYVLVLGWPLGQISTLIGHKSEKTTSMYVKNYPDAAF